MMLAVAALTAVGFFADRLQRRPGARRAPAARRRRAWSQRPADAAGTSPSAHARWACAPRDSVRSRAWRARPTTHGGASAAGRGEGGRATATRCAAALQLQGAATATAPRPCAARAGARHGVGRRRAAATRCSWRIGEPLLLGDAALTIARVIVDRARPRRRLHELRAARDAARRPTWPATGLVQPASRVTYRLAVAAPDGPRGRGARASCAGPRRASSAVPLRGVRVESLESGRPEMQPDAGPRREIPEPRRAAGRAAGRGGGGDRRARLRRAPPRRLRDAARAGPGAAAHRRRLRAGVRALSGWPPASPASALGWAVHHVFVWLLAGLVRRDAAAAGRCGRRCSASASGMTLLLGFGLPPVLQLARVPPLRVIRRDVGALKAASLAVLAAGTARLRGAAAGGGVRPQARR
ncbi:MAG: hypothetical protein MZW92_22955 [Comamonadaceae bacterium]|nr:hypothetical protein [Comamonadaceae bacterium]